MAQFRFSRRHVLAAAAGCIAAGGLANAKPRIDIAQRKFLELERRHGGRLGVCILNTVTGQRLGHRMEERFAMCSTFKLPLAAMILRAADQGKLNLETFIAYSKADMLAHAPVTEANLPKGGMTIRELAEAAQKQSDNPAANLLLKQIDGPTGLTQCLRALGDQITRVDRFEPEMNHVILGDDRDTTSPAAMAATLTKILTGDVLAPSSRNILIQWMIETTTGTKRLRAGFPKDWRAGDKTGTGFDEVSGKCNDVALAWPPGKPPLIITAYFNTAGPADGIRDQDQAVLAAVGRLAADWIS